MFRLTSKAAFAQQRVDARSANRCTSGPQIADPLKYKQSFQKRVSVKLAPIDSLERERERIDKRAHMHTICLLRFTFAMVLIFRVDKIKKAAKD